MEVKITHDALDHTLAYHAAQQNNKSDVLLFKLPRYHGSLDLGELSPSLFLMREDGSTDVIKVADDQILVMETDTNTVTVTWTLTDWATAQPGVLYYQLVFRSDEETPKRYATFPAKLTVTRSIDAEETLVSSYPTFFWQWDQEMKKIQSELKDQANTLKYPLMLTHKSPVPSDLDQTELPDNIKEPGSYYGTARDWKMGQSTCSGSYFLIVEQDKTPDADTHLLVQTVFFCKLGRVFTRYCDESQFKSWSAFTELTHYEPNHVQLSRCRADHGFLFNRYSNNRITPGGRCCSETDVQTFENVTVGDQGDVNFTNDKEAITMSIARPLSHGTNVPKGVYVEWNHADQGSYFPFIRVRLGRPGIYDGALGLDYFCNRSGGPLSVAVQLYACPVSLGTQLTDYGSVIVELENDTEPLHMRIPFSRFGIQDPSALTDGTSICCKISWNNATNVGTKGDEVWIGNVGYYNETV